MRRGDLPQILDIERLVFSDCQWTERDFVRRLRRGTIVGFAATSGDDVLGYCVIDYGPDPIAIVRLAVTPAFRRRLVGTQILANIASRLPALRREGLSCLVSDRDLGVHLFLKSCGFEAVHVLRGWQESEDAYLFHWRKSA